MISAINFSKHLHCIIILSLPLCLISNNFSLEYIYNRLHILLLYNKKWFRYYWLSIKFTLGNRTFNAYSCIIKYCLINIYHRRGLSFISLIISTRISYCGFNIILYRAINLIYLLRNWISKYMAYWYKNL